MAKATLADIAKLANVSKTTVSMVINNKDINVSGSTREKILEAVKELNYIPNTVARSLSTKKTETIGVILPDIENPFFAEMIKAIEDTAEKLNYNVIICNSYNSTIKEDKYIRLLISKLVDGVIFISGGNSEESLKLLEDNKIPFVIVDRYVQSSRKYSGVFCSNENGIHRGVKYLYEKGKRHIAFVQGPESIKISILRRNAYEKVAKELGIYDEDLICVDEFTIDGGMRSTEKLMLSGKKIDAIFYSSDVMALGGMKFLLRNGYKIPRDVSVLGYDNINIAMFLEPELSTIAQPIYNMGKEACELIVDIIDEKVKEHKVIYLDPELIERDTVR